MFPDTNSARSIRLPRHLGSLQGSRPTPLGSHGSEAHPSARDTLDDVEAGVALPRGTGVAAHDASLAALPVPVPVRTLLATHHRLITEDFYEDEGGAGPRVWPLQAERVAVATGLWGVQHENPRFSELCRSFATGGLEIVDRCMGVDLGGRQVSLLVEDRRHPSSAPAPQLLSKARRAATQPELFCSLSRGGREDASIWWAGIGSPRDPTGAFITPLLRVAASSRLSWTRDVAVRVSDEHGVELLLREDHLVWGESIRVLRFDGPLRAHH